jgi:hypothetical protein
MARAPAAAPGWRSTTAAATAVDQHLELEDGGRRRGRVVGEEVLEQPAQGGPVRGDHGLGGVAGPGAELDGDIGHVRPAEGLVGEPLLERVPQRLQARRRVVAGQPGLVPQPAQPPLAPPLQGGCDQVVLAGEVPVHGHGGDAGLGDHAVDAGGADALVGEEPGRRVQDLLVCPGGRHVVSRQRR